MTVIIDYGVGNVFSLSSSLRVIGEETEVTSDRERIRKADRIILPGVGAFGDAAGRLRAAGLDRALLDEAAAGKSILGICLGMQLLFEKSFEFGEHEGLGLIPGEVISMKGRIPENYSIPHIGWNALKIKRDHPVLRGAGDGAFVYFVHSFYAPCGEYTVASAEYGEELTAAAANGNVLGCQFHPEKSGSVGLGILKAFCEG